MRCPNPACECEFDYKSLIDGTKCPICTEALYRGKIHSKEVYYPSKQSKIFFDLENRGIGDFLISEIEIGNQMFSCSSQLISEKTTIKWEFSLPEKILFGEQEIKLWVYINQRKIQLPLESGRIKVLPWPEFEILTNTLKFKPSTDFKTNVELYLKNFDRTSCRIERLRIVREGLGTPLIDESLPVELNNKNKKIIVSIHHEEINPGEYPAHLYIMGCGGMELYKEKVTLEYYSIPDIQLEMGRWKKDNYENEIILIDGKISWRAPAFTCIRKRLSLIAMDSSEDQEFVEKPVFVHIHCPIAVLNEGKIQFSERASVTLELQPIDQAEFEEIAGGRDECIQRQTISVNIFNKILNQYKIDVTRFQTKDAPLGLSLDFGTTACCVAIVKPDREGDCRNFKLLDTIPLEFEDPFWLFPSVVCADDKEGKVLVGSEAGYRKGKPPKAFMFQDKEGKQSIYKEHALIIMKTCLQRTLDWLVEQPNVKQIFFKTIALTVPTSFPLLWKQELRDICKKASESVFGECKVITVEESLAAVSYFLSDLIKENGNDEHIKRFDYIVICDFGGGSTDITFLSRNQEVSHPPFIPIFQGGMRSFASYQIDNLIAEKLGISEDKIEYAESIKKSLSDMNVFSRLIQGRKTPDGRQIDEPVWRKIFIDLHSLLRQEITEKFKECFEKMIKELPDEQLKNIQLNDKTIENTPDRDRNVLLLLAGDGSRLENFSEYVRNAWMKATQELKVNFGKVEVERVSEPKRCVALGGFIEADSGLGGIPPLQNPIPEDVLIDVTKLNPPNIDKVFKVDSKKFYRLFKAGQQLDNKRHEASVIVNSSELGLTLVLEEVSFMIYTRFPGEDPIHYKNLICQPSPCDKKSSKEFIFVYNPKSQDSPITVTCS